MKPNLGGEGFIRKPKLKKLSRTSLRLRGWIRFRLNRAATCFVWLRVDEFCKLTGVTERTARRAINTLRGQTDEFIFRTINRKGKWQILVSTPAKLQKHAKSEPCLMDENGNKQLVKTSLKGETITQEQLLLSENPVFWYAKAKGKDEEADVQKPTEVAESPKQMKMTHWLTQNSKSDSERLHDTNEVKTSATQSHFTNPTNANTWSVKNGARESDKIPCVVTKGNSKEFKNNHSKRVFSLKKMKLAFHLAREMRNFHYENCKIKWEMCFAYSFARESLMKNARKQTILRAWDLAVHQKHADAVDQGVTQAGSWRASSTLATARRILVEGECFNRWKPSFVMA
jgi:hypothetical protein